MREICTSGPVGGKGGNILTYPAYKQLQPIPHIQESYNAQVNELRGAKEATDARVLFGR